MFQLIVKLSSLQLYTIQQFALGPGQLLFSKAAQYAKKAAILVGIVIFAFHFHYTTKLISGI